MKHLKPMSKSECEILNEEFWSYTKEHTGLCNPVEGKTAEDYRKRFKNGYTHSNREMKAIAKRFVSIWYGSYRNEDISKIVGVSVRWIQYWAKKNVGEQPKLQRRPENHIDRNK